MAGSPIATFSKRLAYGTGQATRVAWYTGHSLAMRRMVRAMSKPQAENSNAETPAEKEESKAENAEKKDSRPFPSMQKLLQGVAALLARDMAHVEEGLYPLPRDNDGGLLERVRKSRLFFRELPQVTRRRQDRRHQEVNTEENREKYPRYYLQNFHFQTDGWLSADSAKVYDMQVETLFLGSTAAMRRMGVAEVARAIRGKDQRKLAYADIASGTGGFFHEVKRAYPRLGGFMVDLSEPYLEEALSRGSAKRRIMAVNGNAEALPFAENALDILSCVYLFHELPPKIRRAVASEFARTLKPGGTLVLVDSLQTGDTPEYDPLLEAFPRLFHEPYYAGYLTTDIGELFTSAGLCVEKIEPAFFSKVFVFRKPDQDAG